jgi:aminocarboxymuconate-semialdehyde decarboxylase
VNNRRAFLSTSAKALGGLTFCGCGLLHAANAQTNKPLRRPPVIINGKKIKAIDVHAHCLFQDSIDLMGEDAKSVPPPTKGVKEHFIQVDERIAKMQSEGIDLQVLSVNPFWYRQNKETAAEICRINNKNLAELSAQKPDHFRAFASLAMQFPELAVEQLEEAVKKYGLVGAAIGGSVLGDDFSNPKYHPVLAKAQELNVALFIHPQSTPQLASRFKGNGWLSNVIGNPLDTTIALQRLIFDGIFDKYPQLKVIGAHGGGYLGSYAPRSDHGCFISPQNCDPSINLKKKPTEYLRQIYFDSLVFTPEALRHLVAQVGASQIMIGTDHPIPWEEKPVDHVMATPNLSNQDRINILSSNAAKVLGIKI